MEKLNNKTFFCSYSWGIKPFAGYEGDISLKRVVTGLSAEVTRL